MSDTTEDLLDLEIQCENVVGLHSAVTQHQDLRSSSTHSCPASAAMGAGRLTAHLDDISKAMDFFIPFP